MKSPNEALCDFTPNDSIRLLSTTTTVGPLPPNPVELSDAIDIAAIHAKRNYDSKHQTVYVNVGDKVYLRLHRGYNLPSQPHHEFGIQRTGPFKVTERIGRLAYRLKLPEHWRVHDVFSIAHLEPAPKTSDPYQRSQPPPTEPIIVDGSEEWEIKELLDKRVTRTGRISCLVRWKDCGPHEDSWRPLSALKNCPELIKRFERLK